jgi:hypothetical protein
MNMIFKEQEDKFSKQKDEVRRLEEAGFLLISTIKVQNKSDLGKIKALKIMLVDLTTNMDLLIDSDRRSIVGDGN